MSDSQDEHHVRSHVHRSIGEPVSVELKVPFHDCDPLFVVWHGRYFEYLEVARSALLASRELDVEHVRAMGYKMYIAEARCRYLSPLSYNDMAQITARFTASKPLIRVSYEVKNLTRGRKAARAFTTMATTDFADNLLETPDDVLARIHG